MRFQFWKKDEQAIEQRARDRDFSREEQDAIDEEFDTIMTEFHPEIGTTTNKIDECLEQMPEAIDLVRAGKKAKKSDALVRERRWITL
jgi:hypothetical protein